MQTIDPAARRALKIIAAATCTDRALVARGYSLDLLAGLVRAGFAEFTVERVGSGRTADLVCHMQATNAGMRVLASNRRLPAIQPMSSAA